MNNAKDIRLFTPANLLTLGNLLAGVVALIVTLRYHAYETAFWLIIAASVCDFLDGFVARLLHQSSPLGVQLDSLADDVTFGVAPAMIVFSLFKEVRVPDFFSTWEEYFPYAAFLIAVFSALRLAKFNIDTRQTSSFIGVPTPANALFWGALVLGSHDKVLAHPYGWVAILLLVGIFSWLLVAEIPMFSLKFKSLAWKANRIAYTFLLVSLVLLLLLGINGLSAIIGWYIILSVLTQKRG
jgi:CDP-diacylglycerol--serine O-phosphatidyltransferase